MKLNRPQKLLLAAFGLIILVIQLHKFAEYGVEGASWVIALVVSVLLILPLVGDLTSSRAKAALQQPPDAQPGRNQDDSAPASSVADFHALQRALEPSIADVVRRASELESATKRWTGLSTMADSGLLPDLSLHIRPYCLAYVYGLYDLVAPKNEPERQRTERRNILRARIAKLMAKCSEEALGQLGATHEVDRKQLMSGALRDLVEVEFAVAKFHELLASGHAKPDAPLVNYFMNKVGISPDAVATVATGLQEFGKATVSSLAAARRVQGSGG